MGRKTEHHSIVTPELIAKVNQDNLDLCNEFIDFCKSKNMSHKSIEGYINDIQIFYIWNLEKNKNKFFVDLNKREIMKYQSWIVNELNLSPNRVRRLKAALSSMSNFIENILDDDYPTFKNIINKIPAPPKQEVREKTVLSDEQLDELLKYLVDNKKYQQACVLALAIASGARKSELLRFKVSYFTDENIMYNSLYKTPEKIKTKGQSGGKFIYKYVLVSKFKPYFDLWMAERKELGIEGEELFWTKRHEVWSPANISLLNSWAISFSEIMNGDFYFHSCRHYFTSDLCKANVPVDIIKDIVGWDSPNMVNIYNDNEVDDELGKYFDENGIKQVEQKGLKDLK